LPSFEPYTFSSETSWLQTMHVDVVRNYKIELTKAVYI